MQFAIKHNVNNQRFGRLIVKEYLKKGNWLCLCDCGNTTTASGFSLINGLKVSCGCFSREITAERMKTHGQTETRIYYIWESMRARCTNPNNKSFAQYGGRGITVCEEWQKSFESFWKWATANGYTDELTIDRIDNDKGYSPENCRWADRYTQSRNRRNNVFMTYKGQTKTLGEWGEEYGINPSVLWKRLIDYRWDAGKTLLTPVKHYKKRENTMLLTYDGKTKTLEEWSRETEIKPHTIYYRVFVYGWNVERALTTFPTKGRKKGR